MSLRNVPGGAQIRKTEAQYSGERHDAARIQEKPRERGEGKAGLAGSRDESETVER